MLKDLLDRNVKWSEQKKTEEPGYFARLATRQSLRSSALPGHTLLLDAESRFAYRPEPAQS